MARGGKKAGGASASDGFASPVNAASKKRKSEALLKDLLGTTDDGLVRARCWQRLQLSAVSPASQPVKALT